MKLHPSIETLVQDIDAYCAQERITASEFGSAALGDPSFRGDLNRGRMPSFRTIDRVRFFMEHGKRAEETAA